jgi:hypothetical protein
MNPNRKTAVPMTQPPNCQIILHIGTHKTGSTSIQNYLMHNQEQLRRNGFVFLCGPTGKPNFKEIFHAACAPQRRHLLALRHPEVLKRMWIKFGLKRFIAKHVRENLGLCTIISSELLSLLRLPEEIEKLGSLFPATAKFKIILCLREKPDFLESMKRQLRAQDITLSKQQNNSNYVEPDSWLVDYDSILRAFRQLSADIQVIDFSREQKNGGNIIVPFMAALGVADTVNPAELPYLNRRSVNR